MVNFQLWLKMFKMVMRGLFILLHHVVGDEDRMVQELMKDYDRFIAHPVVIDEDEEER